jgi:hypothetical protein
MLKKTTSSKQWQNKINHLWKDSIKIFQGFCPLEKIYQILQKILQVLPVLPVELNNKDLENYNVHIPYKTRMPINGRWSTY